jgi:hypothetical protein
MLLVDKVVVIEDIWSAREAAKSTDSDQCCGYLDKGQDTVYHPVSLWGHQMPQRRVRIFPADDSREKKRGN